MRLLSLVTVSECEFCEKISLPDWSKTKDSDPAGISNVELSSVSVFRTWTVGLRGDVL